MRPLSPDEYAMRDQRERLKVWRETDCGHSYGETIARAMIVDGESVRARWGWRVLAILKELDVSTSVHEWADFTRAVTVGMGGRPPGSTALDCIFDMLESMIEGKVVRILDAASGRWIRLIGDTTKWAAGIYIAGSHPP